VQPSRRSLCSIRKVRLRESRVLHPSSSTATLNLIGTRRTIPRAAWYRYQQVQHISGGHARAPLTKVSSPRPAHG
jgi:hypothetical protein